MKSGVTTQDDLVHTQRYQVLEEMKFNLLSSLLWVPDQDANGIHTARRIAAYMQDLEWAKWNLNEDFEKEVQKRLGEVIRSGK